MIPSPTQSDMQAQLANFIRAVLPTTGPDSLPLDVITAQQNRIPAPRGSSYVILTPIRFERIETNVDTYQDCRFTGSIAGTVMTVDAVQIGVVQIGATVQGTTVTSGTVISAQTSGSPGGAGAYTVGPSQTVSLRVLSAGGKTVQQAIKATIQCDFHSADYSAGDNCNVVSTLLRDEFGISQFANQSPNYGIVPLLVEDARQIPFTDDSQMVEWRWAVEALLQCNIVISVPQEFADAVDLGLVSVEAVYPS